MAERSMSLLLLGLRYIAILLLIGSCSLVAAQTSRAAGDGLRGLVIDETGAVIEGAEVTLIDKAGNQQQMKTDSQGRFQFKEVKPGTYTLIVESQGFATYQKDDLVIGAKQPDPLQIKLGVVLSAEVTVRDETNEVSLDPSNNASAMVLRERDLEALPDDPDELLQTLRQMAGADNAQVIVDGFRERGRIPPKEAIFQIRINSSPFSAEHSEGGFNRIEIITRPGTDNFRGGYSFRFNDESLNARQASAPTRAPLQIRNYNFHLSGPLIRKRASFFVEGGRREEDENEVVNARILDPSSFQVIPFATTVLTPTRQLNMSLRTDYLLSPNKTLGIRFGYNSRNRQNQDVGGFNLPEHAALNHSLSRSLRITQTTILGEQAVNELRLRVERERSGSNALTNKTAINVLDAFTAGGNQQSFLSEQIEDELEFAEVFSLNKGNHNARLGLTIEGNREADLGMSNYRGTFTFSSIDQYRDVLLGVSGARPAQFSITRGDPFASVNQWEFSYFLSDDWKLRPDLTVSLGLRHEFQTNLRDKLNFAPRIAFAWAPGGGRRMALRGGFGIFYDRFSSGTILNVLRNSSGRQRQFIVQSPPFFFFDLPGNIDELLAPATVRSNALRTIDPGVKAPYSIMSSIELDRQLPKGIMAGISYRFHRGVHLLRSRNINAPLPGSLALPFPDKGPILEYETVGESVRHELRFNFNRRMGRNLTFFGNYAIASSRTNAEGMPANSYDLDAEWGRASNDSRHRLSIGSTIDLPWRVRLAPRISFSSAAPYNITTGRDNNRDTSFSDRPAIVDPSRPGAIITPFGALDPNPQPGDRIIERNAAEGAGFFNVDLTLSKTFGFGAPARRSDGGRGGRQDGPGANRRDGQAAGGRGNNSGDRGGDFGANRGGGGDFAGGRGPGGPGGLRGGPGGPGGGRGDFGGRGGREEGGNDFRYNFTISINASNLFNNVNLSGFSGVITSPFFGIASRTGRPRRVEVSLRFNF